MVVVLAALFAMPIFVTFTNSFMDGFEIRNRYALDVLPANYLHTLDILPQIHFVRMTLIPSFVTLSQYIMLFMNIEYITSLWNSVLITLPSVVGSVFIALPTAYAFEMAGWRHKEKLFFIFIVVMLMPLPVVLVPQFIMAMNLGIHESMLAVILPGIFNPFAVFLLRQFMKTFPKECLEAAQIDGAGHVRILASIVTPIMKPALTALALLVFVDYWNVVDQAIVFITDIGRLPLSVYLSRIVHSFDFIFAASFFYMLPALFVFLWGQESLVQGIKMSRLK